MGNASSSGATRDRHKSGDSIHGSVSPGVKDGQAFTFEKPSPAHPKILQFQESHDEDSEPYFTKAGARNKDFNEPDEVGPKSQSSHTTSVKSRSSLLTFRGDNKNKEVQDVFPGGRMRASTVSEGTNYSSSPTPMPMMSRILPTVFKWDGGGKHVFISGSFSDWKTIPMVKSHGDFVTIVDLPEGEHQYKFYIDGQWKLNPSEPTTDSEIGSKNNIISVKKTDFEVFDALDMDSITSASNQPHKYGQEVPSYKPWEKTTGPPILPPHLLQVILNKDTPLSCEPTLLPEPNHVMLNHLYALSIKDGVMVLSATHRYRKKYVTTLLYKPI